MMANNESATFLKLMNALAEQVNKKLSPVAVEIYLEELGKYNFAEINKVLKSFFAIGKFPTIDEIKKRMGVSEVSELNDDESARLIVSRVVCAISKFGYTALMSEKRTAELKEFLGDDGWHLVQSAGGWASVCETETDSLPTVTAQWRELAKCMSHRKHRDNYLALNPEIRNLLLGDGR